MNKRVRNAFYEEWLINGGYKNADLEDRGMALGIDINKPRRVFIASIDELDNLKDSQQGQSQIAKFETDVDAFLKRNNYKMHFRNARGLAEAEAMEKKAEAMAKYGKAAMTEMIIKVLPQMAEAIAKPLESIDKVTIIDGGSGENGVGTFSGNVPSVLAKTIESIKETTGFDLTEVMKANTYDAKTTKNVNFTGLPEEMSAAAKEPETDGKTE